MNNIRVYSSKGQKAKLSIHIDKMKYYIAKVLKRIGEDDNDIKWYICEEGDFPDQKNTLFQGALKLELLSGVITKPRYGMIVLEKR